MTDFTDNLWRDLVRDQGPALATAAPARSARPRVLRRPRALAGGTLGLAGMGAALMLVLGGTAATTPAFAITTAKDGTVQVELNQQSALRQVNAKLTAMGTGEEIEIQMAEGPAPAAGAVTCTPSSGASGPAISVLNGDDGTQVIPAGNTGAGTWHLAACTAYPAGTYGNSGAATGAVVATKH